MSEVPLLLAVFWGAANPPASLTSVMGVLTDVPSGRRRALAAVGWAIAAALLLLAVALHEPLLDLLEVSPPSFDVAAGLVMLVGAVRPLVRGRAIEEATAGTATDGWRAAAAPLAVPLLATPAALAAAIAYGERSGEAQTAVVSLALVAVTAALLAFEPAVTTRLGRAPIEALARLTGALLVAVAVGLVVDGVLSI